jgi:3-phenylpropionate/trans-cinnamate dioxygenase ferredoxin subunit
MKSVSVSGVHVVICNVEGEFYAMHDQCTHEYYSLSSGTLDGTRLTCLLHGACFDVTSGAVLSPPAYEAVRTYPVRLDGEDILIAI